MKINYILIFFVLISCKSINIKDLEPDYTQDYKGSIESINVLRTVFSTSIKDSIIRKNYSSIYFDKKNRVLKRVDSNANYTTKTKYIYNKGLLQSTISENNLRTRKIDYKYDNYKKIISYKSYENDKLQFSKITKYDKKNNVIERFYYNSIDETLANKEIYRHDYKNKTYTVTNFKDNLEDKIHLNIHHNKNGYIIKIESLDKSNHILDFSTYNYDNDGNLSERASYDENKNLITNTTFKNSYDKKGNILIRECYIKNKLYERNEYDIKYTTNNE